MFVTMQNMIVFIYQGKSKKMNVVMLSALYRNEIFDKKNGQKLCTSDR